MIDSVTQQIFREMKSHPFTLVTVLVLLGFAFWSYVNHARADEIRAQITSLASTAEANTKKIDRVLKLQIAESIRSVKAQECNATGSTQNRLRDALEQLQEEYRSINRGVGYEPPPCEVLK